MSHELETPPAHLMQGTVWRHKKRGTIYRVILMARMQSSIQEIDDKLVVVYCVIESGRETTGAGYTRTYDEFTDGRFERIS